MFIDGEWRDATSGATVEAVSPATGESLGPVAEGDRADARLAIAAANAAFPAWGARTGFERGALLHRVADVMEGRSDELARVLTLDQGKPLKAEAEVEVGELVEFFRMAAEDGKRLEGSIPQSAAPDDACFCCAARSACSASSRRGTGPTPCRRRCSRPRWPAATPSSGPPRPRRRCAPALLAECVAEADLPAGRLQLCAWARARGGRRAGGEPWDPRGCVHRFDGDRADRLAAGRRQGAAAGDGGNGPLVVLEDADLAAAAEAARVGSFLGAGQSCSAAERILVHEAVRDEFVSLLASEVEREVRLGDPLDDATTMGPVNNEPGAAKMDAHVADAVERGATVVTGGSRADGFPTGLYWEPTVLNDVPPDSIAVTQETFGPIAPIVGIGSLEDAIEQTNVQTYGLMAAIFTADLAAGMRYADSVAMGLVNINETTNYWEPHLPWGGRARSQSGIGRVGGRYPMDTLTELQTVLIKA